MDKAEQLKHTTVFHVLKKNKQAQKAAVKLGASEEWAVLKQFAAELKQTLLEATLEVDNLEDIKRFRFLIQGVESIIFLPGLVKFVGLEEKEAKEKNEQLEKDKKRMKFNPGSFIKNKLRGGVK